MKGDRDDAIRQPGAASPPRRDGPLTGPSGVRAGTLCLLAVMLWLSGCGAIPDAPEEESPPQTVWPLPPEPPRYRHEITLVTEQDLRRGLPETRLQDLLTGEVKREHEVPLFMKPFDVAARAGRIYVSDTISRLIHVIDVPRRKVFRFGFRREGTLGKPMGVAVDGNGMIYVADASGRRVICYDSLGLYRRDFGTPQLYDRPTSVAVSSDGTRIYVVDTGGVGSRRHRLLIFDGEGRLLREVGTRGSGPGEFNLPTDAATGPTGEVYVLDAGNFRVQVFDPDGNHLASWGRVGNGLGQFARPRAIAVDANNRVYVTDASFGNIQVFDRNGRLLIPIGTNSTRPVPGSFPLVAGIASDETNRIYVIDQFFKKLDVFRYVAEP